MFEKRNTIRLDGNFPPLRIKNKSETFLKMFLREIPFDLTFDVIKKMAQVEKIEFQEDGITRKFNVNGEFIGRRVIDYGCYRLVADRDNADSITIVSAYNKSEKNLSISLKAQKLSFDLMKIITGNLKARDISTIKGGQ